MIYLDANVFVLAALNTDGPGDEARSLLGDIQSGNVEACSSALTLDELVWAVKRSRGPGEAVAAGEIFLGMPRLGLVGVERDLLGRAMGVMKKYGLDPRDSIHAASALVAKAEAIVSSDRHFDKFKEIPRKSVSEAKMTSESDSSRGAGQAF